MRFGQQLVLDHVVRVADELGVTVVLSTHVLAEVEQVFRIRLGGRPGEAPEEDRLNRRNAPFNVEGPGR